MTDTILTLLTICVGGVSASIITYALEARKGRVLRKKEKIEELYIITNKWISNIFSLYLINTKAVNGEISIDDAHDAFINNNFSPQDYEKVEMYIKIYFPDLSQDYERLVTVRDKMNRLWAGFKENYKSGKAISPKWKDGMDTLLPIFVDLGDNLQQKIINLAAKI